MNARDKVLVAMQRAFLVLRGRHVNNKETEALLAVAEAIAEVGVAQSSTRTSRDLQDEYTHSETRLCGLCGNYGVIDTRGRMKSPAGVECGVRQFCICINGRAWKEGGADIDKLNSYAEVEDKQPVAWVLRPGTAGQFVPIYRKVRL